MHVVVLWKKERQSKHTNAANERMEQTIVGVRKEITKKKPIEVRFVKIAESTMTLLGYRVCRIRLYHFVCVTFVLCAQHSWHSVITFLISISGEKHCTTSEMDSVEMLADEQTRFLARKLLRAAIVLGNTPKICAASATSSHSPIDSTSVHRIMLSSLSFCGSFAP